MIGNIKKNEQGIYLKWFASYMEHDYYLWYGILAKKDVFLL